MTLHLRELDLHASVVGWKETAVSVHDGPPSIDRVVHRAQVVVRLAERKIGDHGVGRQPTDRAVDERCTARELEPIIFEAWRSQAPKDLVEQLSE